MLLLPLSEDLADRFGSKLNIRSKALQNGFSTEHLIFFTVGLHPVDR